MYSMSDISKAAICACYCDLPAARQHLRRPVARLQFATLIWMLVECTGSNTPAGTARSVALLAFGS
jgi:hypothetical protein